MCDLWRAGSAVHSDILQAPAVHHSFLEDPQDAKDLAGGIKAIRRILVLPAMASYLERELTLGSERADDAALLDVVRSNGGTVYHHADTGRMGNNEPAVEDDRLRVADASIIPTVICGKTNAPTVMIAQREAHWIMRDAKVAIGLFPGCFQLARDRSCVVHCIDFVSENRTLQPLSNSVTGKRKTSKRKDGQAQGTRTGIQAGIDGTCGIGQIETCSLSMSRAGG